MSRQAFWAVTVLAGWSLLVWSNRLSNVTDDAELTGSGQLIRGALALSFMLLSAACLVLVWQATRGARNNVVPFARGLAVWSIVIWVVRGIGIAVADHSVGFIAVHLVLAVLSIVLGVWVLRTVGLPEILRTTSPSRSSS